MAAAKKSLVRRAGEEWAGMLGLTGAFVAGTIFMGTLIGFADLPEKHDADIAALSDRIVPIETYIAEQRVLICIETKQALNEPVQSCVGQQS